VNTTVPRIVRNRPTGRLGGVADRGAGAGHVQGGRTCQRPKSTDVTAVAAAAPWSASSRAPQHGAEGNLLEDHRRERDRHQAHQHGRAHRDLVAGVEERPARRAAGPSRRRTTSAMAPAAPPRRPDRAGAATRTAPGAQERPSDASHDEQCAPHRAAR
jgi:hypothetical protein